MNIFSNSKWIWLSSGESEDQYVEFTDSFEYNGEGEVKIRISVDNDYVLYVNGNYAASSQYGDFEHYKIYDEIEISNLLRMGENKMDIIAYHCGVDTSRYRPARAGLIYEVEVGGKSVAWSDEKTLSRQSPSYASGRKKSVSYQLGFSFFYDAVAENTEFCPSAVVDKKCRLFPRPIKKHTVCEKRPMVSVEQKGENCWLIDLGGEVVGFPTIDIESEGEQLITVAWGEHIKDGGVRRKIGARDFSFEYKAKDGENTFTEYMLRIACRYIEVFSEAPIKINYVGVLPQVYETEKVKVDVDDKLDREIYDICVNTLDLCMMEHYVDCPWREQALYAFDSRNQMLCGYFAFLDKNKEYARANLKLIGKDTRDDGLLSICYPCGNPLAIPSFSLYYFFSMREYIEHTGDVTLAAELKDKLVSVLDTFIKNSKDGFIRIFGGDNMWNFYDWAPHLNSGIGKDVPAIPDLMINCLFVLALDCFEYICGAIGEKFPYKGMADVLRTHINAAFKTDAGIFRMHTEGEEYTSLGNAMAVLSGVVTGKDAERICEAIVGGELTECSLSMKILVYEALLNTDEEKYSSFVLDEIRRNYKQMLDEGSTTVWETMGGSEDFQKAGSLCHGWSAVPVYVYHRLGMAKEM